MSSSVNDLDTLNGYFKTVYGEIQDVRPDHVKLCKLIKFVKPNKRTGLVYKQPVVLSYEHGVSYGGSTGAAFDYNPPISGITDEADIKGCEMVLRGKISVAAVSRSEAGDAAAFGKASKHVVQNLLTSSFKKLENQLWYGQQGLATVASVSGNIITITTAEWAPGIWAGAENMKLSIYDTTGATLRGHCSISSVNIANRTLTVDAAPAGLVSTDVIFEYGAKGKEFLGVHKMLATTSGDVFGIPTGTYSLWSGNTFSAGNAALSFAKISDGIALSVAKGLEGKVSLFVNPKTWADLLSEQTAQRVFHEGGMVEYSNGAESIKFYSQNGIIEIISSTYVKEGYAYALDLESFKRVGSCDITFDMPGFEGKYLQKLENSNAYQLLTYCDVALFCDALGRNLYFSNIVN